MAEEVAEPPAATVRRLERGHKGSVIADKEPIHDEARTRQARMHDRAADQRFVAAVQPSLTPAARERALDVRVKGGDAGLLG